MAYETLIVGLEEHVKTIRLNRPDALNARNAQLLADLSQALDDGEKNAKVRCIVITG